MDKTKNMLHIKGAYDHTPPTFADRMFRRFQRLEMAEKVAEIADESFHLLGSTLQRFAPDSIYQTARMVHHAAHDVEHLLHAVCFFGDLSRVLTGKFLEYRDGHRHEIDRFRTLARVCHTASHFFATLQFLSDQKLVKINKTAPLTYYSSLFGTLGFAIWTATLVWRRYRGEAEERFASDLGIHLGGFFFEAIPLAKQSFLITSWVPVLNKISAMAGIIHAWHVVDRLFPPDLEEISVKYPLPDAVLDDDRTET
jgi:hypothetical protein